MNTDDCCRDNRLAGCGGVFCRSDGEWLVTLLNVLVCVAPIWLSIVEYLKVWSMRERLGFRAIKLNVDSLKVSSENGSLIDRSLVVKILRLLDLEWEVVEHRSYHEADQCDDVLAKFKCLMAILFITRLVQLNSLFWLMLLLGDLSPRV